MSAGDGSASAEHATRTTRLSASPATAGRARSFVVETLRAWQVEDNACDDAELVVSELVTNAFLHGHAAEVGVSVVDRGAHVRLTVSHREGTPANGAPLAPLTAGADDTHGRGLAIVDVLSRAWGVEEAGGERLVWAEMVASRSGLLPVAERDAAIGDLAAALAAAADLRDAGDVVARWARTRLAVSFAGVALRDDDDPERMRYLSVFPLPAASAADWSRFPVDTDAPVAAAFRNARPYFHESRSAAVAGFPRLGPALEASDMVALAHLPLFDVGRPVGTLAFAWSHGRQLEAGDRSWLATVAEVAAVALVRVGAGRRALSEG